MATKVGHWPLQDFDSSSSIGAVTGAAGTIIGGKTSALMSVTGPNAALPRAQKFGIGDYITIPPAGFARDFAQFTMMCWASVPPNTVLVQHPLMMLTKETSVKWPRVSMYVTRLANSPMGQFSAIVDSGAGSTITQAFTPFIDVSGWRHFAITLNYTNGSLGFYVDGVLVHNYTSLSGISTTPDSDPLRFTLGFANIFNSDSPHYSSVAMADARFYNGIMTLSEINDVIVEEPETPPESSPSPSPSPNVSDPEPSPTQLWFTNWPNGHIERADVGSSGLENREIISTGYIDLYQVEVDNINEQLYWTADKKIWRSDLDGSNSDWIIEKTVDVIGLVLDPINGFIYYSTPTEIRRVDYDSTDDQLVTHAVATSLALDILGDQLCYVDAESSNPTITVYNLRTGDARGLPIIGQIGGLRVHQCRLWFTVGGSDEAGVKSCDFFGQDVQTEMLDTREFPKAPKQLEIDHTGIYLNTIDGPDEQWFTPPTLAGLLTGIAHGIVKSQIGEDISWADYLAIQNADDEEEPTDAVGDVTILSSDEVIPTPDAINKLIMITGDQLKLREADISDTPVNVGELTYPVSNLILEGDLASNIQGVVIDPRPVRVVDLETKHIYYAENFDPVQPTANTIRKSHFGDIFSTEVARTRPNPVDLAIDVSEGKLYILTETEVVKSNLDGTDQEVLINTGLGYFGQQSCTWDATNRLLIWTAGRGEEYGVYRGRSSSGRWVVSPSYTSITVQPKGVVADPLVGHIYWCDGLTATLFRMNYDGTGLTEIDLVDHIPLHLKIGATSRAIYWSEPTGIYRSQLDGSDIELVVEDAIHHRFDVLE